MERTTEVVLSSLLAADPGISAEQRDAIFAILRGHVPTAACSGPAGPPATPPARSGVVETPKVPKNYLRRHEAAEYLGCSLRQIDSMKNCGDLAFHRLGRRLIVFKIDDLDAWVLENRIAVNERRKERSMRGSLVSPS